MIPLTTNNTGSTRQTLRELIRHRSFLVLLSIGLVIALIRFFDLDQPLQMLLEVLLFIGGLIIAPVFFLTEQRWTSFLHRFLSFEDAIDRSTSPLRAPIIFLLLPVLGLFVVTSSRAPLGLGFLWGTSMWYAIEVWLLRLGDPFLAHQYFGSVMAVGKQLYQTVFWAYLAYAVILTVLLIVI